MAVIIHPTPRTWLQVALGIGLQGAQGAGLTTLPTWLWADRFIIGKRPNFLEWGGANGLLNLPRDASILTNFENSGEFRAGATFANLGILLPWVTQAAIGSQAFDISKYASIGLKDHPSGKAVIVQDAVPTEFTLESSVATQGVLVASGTFFGEEFDDTGSVGPTSPADKKLFKHNRHTLEDLTASKFIGVAGVTISPGTGFFPWEHNAEFFLARKDGPLNWTGTIDSIHSDNTDPWRESADADAFRALRFKWFSTAATPKVLTITLNDVRFDPPPDTGIDARLFTPFRTGFTNYGPPIVTLA